MRLSLTLAAAASAAAVVLMLIVLAKALLEGTIREAPREAAALGLFILLFVAFGVGNVVLLRRPPPGV